MNGRARIAVRQRGRGWQADFKLPGWPRVRETFKTQAEAQAYELEARAAHALGKPCPKPGAGQVRATKVQTLWNRLRGHFDWMGKDTVIYTFRRTCASRLVQRGVDLYRVQIWMGHKSIQMAQRYAKFAPKHLAELADVLEQPSPRPALKVVAEKEVQSSLKRRCSDCYHRLGGGRHRLRAVGTEAGRCNRLEVASVQVAVADRIGARVLDLSRAHLGLCHHRHHRLSRTVIEV